MESEFSTFESMSFEPASNIPLLTISPAETTLKLDEVTSESTVESPKPEEKKPAKKRKSWGQELPTPKTNLPPRLVYYTDGYVVSSFLIFDRKRAKTEDEKEQRRIERVLRNRAAAQISRERKRLEIEKLETEKAKMEQQNRFLLQRLAQMEAENNRLSQQVAKLSTEIRSSRGASPQSTSAPSPTLAPVLFKQEPDDIEKIPIPTPPTTIYSPSVTVADSTETSDLAQHPAAVFLPRSIFNPASILYPDAPSHPAAPLSDDDFHRLFDGDSSAEPDLSFLEEGFSIDLLSGGDLSTLAFDSMVDFDPDSGKVDNLKSAIGLPDPASHSATSVQPSFGASTERCDEQGIAAGSA
ncbi:transcription factor that binds to CRE motif [Emydomyces testavorans]|uniref:Transcription factor that binds to CRE motif n=1 Tax=Emydomyces testavorans TaxID=2070801 RepID=A0AAF0DMG8_9EURO|nr:transcription factor that binds to CRE motif [Emydomyces testavorans]